MRFTVNPFNSVMFLPLMPAYSKTGNIMSARDEIDKMIVEMIYVLMDFDMADLMSGIGTEVGLTDDSIHTLRHGQGQLPSRRIRRGIQIQPRKNAATSRDQAKEKIDVLQKLQSVLELKQEEVGEIYKDYLIKTNAYNAEEFEDKVYQIIHGSPRFEEDLNLYVRGIEDQINKWIDEAIQFVSTIKLVANDGTIEDSVAKLVPFKTTTAPPWIALKE